MNKIEILENEIYRLKKQIISDTDYILQLSADSEKVEWLEADIKRYRDALLEIKSCLKDWHIAYMSFGFCEYENILNKMEKIIQKAGI